MRSLTKNVYKIEEFLSNCHRLHDIIAVSETKLSQYNINKIHLTNYHFLCINSHTTAGGVGLKFIKLDSNYYVRTDLEFHTNDCENLWIELTYKSDKSNLTIGVIYRHPAHDIKSFQAEFNKTLIKFSQNKENN